MTGLCGLFAVKLVNEFIHHPKLVFVRMNCCSQAYLPIQIRMSIRWLVFVQRMIFVQRIFHDDPLYLTNALSKCIDDDHVNHTPSLLISTSQTCQSWNLHDIQYILTSKTQHLSIISPYFPVTAVFTDYFAKWSHMDIISISITSRCGEYHVEVVVSIYTASYVPSDHLGLNEQIWSLRTYNSHPFSQQDFIMSKFNMVKTSHRNHHQLPGALWSVSLALPDSASSLDSP